MSRTSPNHVVVVEQDQRATLRASAFLLSQLGAPAVFVFRPEGSRVDAGEIFGRVDGPLESCSLRSPFSLVIERVDAAAGEIHARRQGKDEEPLLDDGDYRALVTSTVSSKPAR